MKSSLNWNIGVCSWSLGDDLESLSRLKKETGIDTIHLHIRPELGKQNLNFIEQVITQGWQISCGMVSFEQEDYSTLETIRATGGIVPTESWPKNKNKVCEAIDVISNIGVPYLSFHFGFVDITNTLLVERVRELADYANSKSVILLMETGQETAEGLAGFITKINHSALGVNFDPANMILYNKGEPVDSLDKLKGWVKSIHIKDAVASSEVGQWGKEVRWGDGQINGQAFLDKLAAIGYQGPLCVERECGTKRYADIISAITTVRQFLEK